MIDDPVLVNAGVRPLLGQTVALDITPDSVNLGPASSSQVSAAAAAASAGGSRAPGAGGSGGNGAGSVSKVSTPRLLQLLDCTPSLAGAKASACARLEQVWCMVLYGNLGWVLQGVVVAAGAGACDAETASLQQHWRSASPTRHSKSGSSCLSCFVWQQVSWVCLHLQ